MADYDEILQSMQEEYRTLTGSEPDDASDIGIRLKVLASQVYELSRQVDEIERQVYPHTATGAYLDRHASQRGLRRKQGVCSTGVLVFSRTTAAAYDITVEAGTVCALKDDVSVRYVTTHEAVLPAGELETEAPACAVAIGAFGNAAAGTIRVLVSPPPGIALVTNPLPFAGGGDIETDDDLRKRLLASYAAVSNGTNAAFYYDEAMKWPFVHSCAVLPRNRGTGTVDVVVRGAGAALTDDNLAQVEARLNELREISVDVQVRGAREVVCDIAVEIAPRDDDRFDALRRAATEAVGRYVGSLAIAQPLSVSGLYAALSAVEGLASYRVVQPQAEVAVARDAIAVCGDISVARMGVA